MNKETYKFYLEKCKNNGFTLIVRSKNSRIYLHSKYDSINESKNIVRKYELEKYDFIIILGLGLGYILDYISNKEIYVIEKFNEIYELFKKGRYNFSDNNKIKFYISEAINNIVADITNNFDIRKHKNFTIIELPQLTKLDIKYYKKIKEEILKSINKKINNEITFFNLSISYTNNFFKNYFSLNKLIRLNPYSSSRAIIVGAAPSLEKDIKYIHKLQKNLYIFAVDTVYEYLLKNDIIPDFVFSIDPQFYSYLHFYNKIHNPKTKFIIDIFSFFKLKDILPNYNFILTKNFLTSYFFPDSLLYDFNGGSVANFILYFLLKNGFNMIILSGIDLNFSEHKMYIPTNYLISYFLKRNIRYNTFKNIYYSLYFSRAKIKDDKKKYTSNAMKEYKEYLIKTINNNNFAYIYISKNSTIASNTTFAIDLKKVTTSSFKKEKNIIEYQEIPDLNSIKKRINLFLQNDIDKLIESITIK